MALAACTGLTSGATTPVAIEFVTPPESLAVGDTVVLHIRVLNRDGDSLPGAPIVLTAINPDTLGVDSARLAVFGVAASGTGKGKVVASTGNLRTTPLAIKVVP